MVNIGGQWVNVDPSYQTVGPEAYDQMVPDTQTQGSGRDQLLAILADALTGATDSTEARRQLSAWLKGVGETNTDAVADAWLRQLTEGEYSGVSPAEAISSLMRTLQGDQRWANILGTGTGQNVTPVGGQVGGGDIDPFEEQEQFDPGNAYLRWLQGTDQWRTASPFLRDVARGRSGQMENLYNLSQAADPGSFASRDIGGGQMVPGSAQGFLQYLGSGQRPELGTSMTGLRNVANFLDDASTAPNEDFGLWATGKYGGQEGEENWQQSLIDARMLGLPASLRNAYRRGASRRFTDYRAANPGQSAWNIARQWGLL